MAPGAKPPLASCLSQSSLFQGALLNATALASSLRLGSGVMTWQICRGKARARWPYLEAFLHSDSVFQAWQDVTSALALGPQ